MTALTPPPAEVVTDANLWLHAVMPSYDYHAQALDFVMHCLSSGIRLLTPALWEAEVDSSLRMIRHARQLDTQATQAAFRWMDAAPVDVVRHPNTRTLARQIADIIKAPRVYDATYGALAKLSDCPFWTADERFYNAVQNARVAAGKRRKSPPLPEVHFIKSYAGEYAPI